MKNSKSKNGAEKTPRTNRLKKIKAHSKQSKKGAAEDTAAAHDSGKAKTLLQRKKLTRKHNKCITDLVKKVMNKEPQNRKNSFQLIEKAVTLLQTALCALKNTENMIEKSKDTSTTKDTPQTQ